MYSDAFQVDSHCRFRTFLRACLLARVANREWLGLGVAGTLRSDFFREEYVLDYRLANIAKEQVILSPPKSSLAQYVFY